MKYVLAIIMLLIIGCGEDASGFDIDEPDGSVDGDTDTDTDGDSDSDVDDCEDIICDDIPDNECSEDGDVIVYTGEATCIDGECHYSYEYTECDWGCDIYEDHPTYEDGPHCIDPCDGVVCDEEDYSYCDGNTPKFTVGECIPDDADEYHCDYFITDNGPCEEGWVCEVNIDGDAICSPD